MLPRSLPPAGTMSFLLAGLSSSALALSIFTPSPAIILIVETERRLQHRPDGESRRRTQAKAEDTKASIAQELSAVKKPLPREPVLTAMECDLASLSRYA